MLIRILRPCVVEYCSCRYCFMLFIVLHLRSESEVVLIVELNSLIPRRTRKMTSHTFNQIACLGRAFVYVISNFRHFVFDHCSSFLSLHSSLKDHTIVHKIFSFHLFFQRFSLVLLELHIDVLLHRHYRGSLSIILAFKTEMHIVSISFSWLRLSLVICFYFSFCLEACLEVWIRMSVRETTHAIYDFVVFPYLHVKPSGLYCSRKSWSIIVRMLIISRIKDPCGCSFFSLTFLQYRGVDSIVWTSGAFRIHSVLSYPRLSPTWKLSLCLLLTECFGPCFGVVLFGRISTLINCLILCD